MARGPILQTEMAGRLCAGTLHGPHLAERTCLLQQTRPLCSVELLLNLDRYL